MPIPHSYCLWSPNSYFAFGMSSKASVLVGSKKFLRRSTEAIFQIINPARMLHSSLEGKIKVWKKKMRLCEQGRRRSLSLVWAHPVCGVSDGVTWRQRSVRRDASRPPTHSLDRARRHTTSRRVFFAASMWKIFQSGGTQELLFFIKLCHLI